MTDTKSFDTIRDDLYSDDVETRRNTLKSLFEERPDDWSEYEPLVDDLIPLLEEEPFLREGASIALQRIGSLDADQRSQVEALIDHENPAVGYRAIDVFHGIAPGSPETITPVAPSVVEFLAVRDGVEGGTPDEWDDDGEVYEHESAKDRRSHTERRVKAVQLLGQVAQEDPSALVPVIDDLVAIAGRGDRAQLRTDVLGILAAVAEEHPEEFGAVIDPVTAILVETADETEAEDEDTDEREDDENIRSNAAFLLAMIADAHQSAVTDAVVDHRETLFEMLESDNDVAQNGVIGLLSYVAEERPEAVEPAKETVFDLLEHDLESVRGNAIWTLSYLGGEDVVDRLETLAEEDPSENIRQHATETVDELTADGVSSDGDGDEDANADTNADVGTGEDTEAETDPDTDSDAETGAGTDADVTADPNTNAQTESSSKTE